MAINDENYQSTETAEYYDLPLFVRIACDIAAFANTNGGRLHFGYRNLEGSLLKHGLTDEQAQSLKDTVNMARMFLRPFPSIDIDVEDTKVDNKQLIIIDVQKSLSPVLYDGRYYIRRGSSTTLAEEDLIDALSESVPTFKKSIVDFLHSEKSLGNNPEDATNTEANEGTTQGQIESGHTKVHQYSPGIFREAIEARSQIDLNELLKDSIQRTREDLTSQRNERLQQARITFQVALVVLILAIVLVFIGVVLIFISKIQAGVVSSVASIVSGIVSALALALNKQTNDRMDEYARELVTLEKSYTGMQYISLMTDVKIRDEAIHELARSISQGKQSSEQI